MQKNQTFEKKMSLTLNLYSAFARDGKKNHPILLALKVSPSGPVTSLGVALNLIPVC